jgi:UDP-N-acetylglucosamine 2-epimerase (non-hydrolysing)
MDNNNHTARKVLVVFGTRPEAIKLAPVVLELQRHSNQFTTVICVTGQHRQMLDQVLQVFQLRPHYDLQVMVAGQSLSGVTTASLNGLNKVLEHESPDLVLVQGDTTTTFVAALTAFYYRVKVAHVEAGLRTGQKNNPFPEEISRRLTTHIADFHFAPTERSRANLLREGISPEDIEVTGNTVIDALFYVRERLARNPSLAVYPEELNKASRMILVTAHRRESFGEQFRQMCEAIRSIALSRPDVLIVYPVHLNPNVQAPVHKILEGIANVRLIEPLEYVSFVALMQRAHILLTDSGGIQEEGPALGKPVLVMRDVSERPEAIAIGTARLVGTNSDTIIGAVNELLDNPLRYQEMTQKPNPYGDGNASLRIVHFLMRRLFDQTPSCLCSSTP